MAMFIILWQRWRRESWKHKSNLTSKSRISPRQATRLSTSLTPRSFWTSAWRTRRSKLWMRWILSSIMSFWRISPCTREGQWKTRPTPKLTNTIAISEGETPFARSTTPIKIIRNYRPTTSSSFEEAWRNFMILNQITSKLELHSRLFATSWGKESLKDSKTSLISQRPLSTYTACSSKMVSTARSVMSRNLRVGSLHPRTWLFWQRFTKIWKNITTKNDLPGPNW